ncbi:DNA polymerase III subunit delta' [Candidatus Kuenenbacteria bacterium]|nr:DNA polymerase III subunit delta' [Candidatus Kuenenbacteria bacterium]
MNGLQFNWPIIGHHKIKQFLQTSIVNDKLAHAYIFYGPEKVGKTLTAKTFANTILCEKYQTYSSPTASTVESNLIAPCGECSSCHQFEKNIYADFYIVEREVDEKTGKKKSLISVAQIRDLLEKISKRAFLNSYKIVIIPEAQKLNQEASNCLLKTLEEPSPRTIIILISPSKELLLPTILSRSQAFKFLAVTKKDIYEYLIGKGANRSYAKELSNVASGRPTVAMKFFNDSNRFLEYKNDNLELFNVFTQSTVEKFKFIEGFVNKNKSKDVLLKKLDYLSSLTRDVLMISSYKNELIANAYLENKLERAAADYSQTRLKNFAVRIEETKDLLRKNINPRLVLENLILNL